MLYLPSYYYQRIFHMNLSQLHERLRLELLRRIERGTASVSLLARQTGLGQPFVSNFLRGRRTLSVESFDRFLGAQRMEIADLLPAPSGAIPQEKIAPVVEIPLVTHGVAMHEPYIRASSVVKMLPFPGSLVAGLEERCAPARKQWERFVVVQIEAEDAKPMDPEVLAGALILLDRHYTSFRPYRAGETNLYAAQMGSRLVVRYAQFQADRVVLRARAVHVEAEVLEPAVGQVASDLLVGRVVRVVNKY